MSYKEWLRRNPDKKRVLNMPTFIDAKNLQPFISKNVRGELTSIEALGDKILPDLRDELDPNVPYEEIDFDKISF